MLVVISDLHFTDATSGRHNLPSGAFTSVFLSDVGALARDKEATEVKLLLLGDIVDLVRTTQWFQEDVEDRPWGRNGLQDVKQFSGSSATEERCLRILGQMPADGQKSSVPEDTILYQNWDTFAFFRSFEDHMCEEIGHKVPVQLLYMPGNHDRFCNLYPSVRDALEEMMGITVAGDTVDGDPDGTWWYCHDFLDEDYGVFARHGHEYDAYNYGGGNDYTLAGHRQPCIGDVIATEFAVKLAYKVSAMSEDPSNELSAGLAEQMKDMDLVRPLSSIIEWFYYRIQEEDRGGARQALKHAFREVVDEFLDLRFVQQWRAPGLLADDAMRTFSQAWLQWIPSVLIDKLDAEDMLSYFLGQTKDPERPEKDPFVQAAYSERRWKENPAVRFVLYGHTHAPLQVGLDGANSREVLYINTGTWRERIYRTVGFDKEYDFIKLKQMSYAVFYHKNEDRGGKQPGTVSCDIWTGHKSKYYS